MSFEGLSELIGLHPLLAGGALVCAVLAISILCWFLAKQPAFTPVVKLVLACGFGVFPIGAAILGNAANLKMSMHRGFCASCHVMRPYTDDSDSRASTTLAARHARNDLFGDNNCYTCHQDYGLYGTVVTKLSGMRHVWLYYTEFKDYTVEEALPRIKIAEAFNNSGCTHCHSGSGPVWRDVSEHSALEDELRAADVSCISRGCHGPSHPFRADLKAPSERISAETGPAARRRDEGLQTASDRPRAAARGF